MYQVENKFSLVYDESEHETQERGDKFGTQQRSYITNMTQRPKI